MILHVVSLEKFIPPFIEFLGEHFDLSHHRFWLKGDRNKYPYQDNQSTYQVNPGVLGYLHGYLKLIVDLNNANKIILHNLFDIKIVFLLVCMPWLLKKSYWVIWGADLYVHQVTKKKWRWHRNEWIRRFAISRLGHFITHIRGDYELAQNWYGARGQWHECFMYTSNLYRDYPIEPKPHDGIHILLGNSATSTNNHLDALEKLRPFAHDNIKIYCPLSYGDASYGDLVERAGVAIFGSNFIPLRDFIPFERYLELLSDIDIAVFNHNRQQGMGNITTLLGMGKTVYIRSDISSWTTLNKMGLVLGDTLTSDFRKLPKETILANRAIVAKSFSERALIHQLSMIFEN